MIETRRTCVIAMSHLTEQTAQMLFSTPLTKWPVMGAPMGLDALMVYAHTETGDDVPGDLRDVITWARKQMPPGATPDDPGFEYILLDNDAPAVPGLHDYCAHERAAPPPEPWTAREGEFWARGCEGPDIGGQRMRIVQDGRGDPLAWVLADEEDAEAEEALKLILAAPKTAKALALIIKGATEIGEAAEAYDMKMCGGPDGEGESRPPDGDDYNEMRGWLMMLLGVINDAGKAAQ